jgi:V/A-type H+-transporting ATPase subunit A
VDFVILQQDAFDEIDSSSSMERQTIMMDKVLNVCHQEFEFESFEEVTPFFKEVINTFRQMNYSEFKSDKYYSFEKELEAKLAERRTA